MHGRDRRRRFKVSERSSSSAAAGGIAPADVSLLGLGDMFNIGSLFSGRGLDVQLKCFPVAHIGRDELEVGNLSHPRRLPSWKAVLSGVQDTKSDVVRGV